MQNTAQLLQALFSYKVHHNLKLLAFDLATFQMKRSGRVRLNRADKHTRNDALSK
jgi:hypothetical protein